VYLWVGCDVQGCVGVLSMVPMGTVAWSGKFLIVGVCADALSGCVVLVRGSMLWVQYVCVFGCEWSIHSDVCVWVLWVCGCVYLHSY